VRPRVALVSARAARDLDEDLPPLIAAFAAAGAEATVADWDDAQVDWAAFRLALLRSAWDYPERLAEFLAWADRTAKLTTLLNPPAVLRWNTDKHYLGVLARAGVPIVPTRFIEPAEHGPRVLERLLREQGTAEWVVKPAVGAGSRDAARYTRGDERTAGEHIVRLLAAGRSVMLQPYLDQIDVHGETALIYFAGRFSHAVRKGPLLQRSASPTAALFAAEQIRPRIPAAEELQVADRALAALPFAMPLYARVDLIPFEGGNPCVLELELTEPSLFFAQTPAAADRFARLCMELTRSRPEPR
jgi:O-ureido-D-serine cyclo-ligase